MTEHAPHGDSSRPVAVELSRPAAEFLCGMVAHLNTVKQLPETGREQAIQTSAWLEEIDAAVQRGLADA